MLKRTDLILLFLLFQCFPALVKSQELKEKLFRAGFEQVHVIEKKDSVLVFFEHRSFRNPFHSFDYAKKITEENENRVLTWIPLYNNKPIGAYQGEQLQFRSLFSEELDYFRRHNNLAKGYRFHFRIMPDFYGRFGRFDQPLETKTNIIVDTRIYLLPGLSLQSGILFPLQNSLDYQENIIRLAPSHLHYFTQFRPSHFLSLTTGTFFYDRYGVDLQYRYAPLNTRWSGGLESGYTGFYYLPGSDIYMGPLDDFYLVGDVEYRLPISNLSLRISAGQFLFKDRGARADLIRQFGGVDVGFYVTKTQKGTTAGFQLAFSLFPGKILRTKKLELRTTEEFRWEYSYSNAAVGRKYRLGIPRLNDQLRQYNALFVKSQLR